MHEQLTKIPIWVLKGRCCWCKLVTFCADWGNFILTPVRLSLVISGHDQAAELRWHRKKKQLWLLGLQSAFDPRQHVGRSAEAAMEAAQWTLLSVLQQTCWVPSVLCLGGLTKVVT